MLKILINDKNNSEYILSNDIKNLLLEKYNSLKYNFNLSIEISFINDEDKTKIGCSIVLPSKPTGIFIDVSNDILMMLSNILTTNNNGVIIDNNYSNSNLKINVCHLSNDNEILLYQANKHWICDEILRLISKLSIKNTTLALMSRAFIDNTSVSSGGSVKFYSDMDRADLIDDDDKLLIAKPDDNNISKYIDAIQIKEYIDIDNKINNAIAQSNGVPIEINGNQLPQGDEIPSVITLIGTAQLYGNDTGTIYYQVGGNSISVSPNKFKIAYYNRETNLWSAPDVEYSVPKGADGDSILPLFDKNKVNGYNINNQVVDDNGYTYVSLKNQNNSSLNIESDWRPVGLRNDVIGGALSYEKGKRLLDNTVPKSLPYTRVSGTIVRGNDGEVIGNGDWDTIVPINVIKDQKFVINCFQNPSGIYENWGRPALYDDNLNFIQFLGFNPDKDGYITPSTFDIKIPSNGNMIISTLTGRTLQILDPSENGVGMIYITPDSLDEDGSALSYNKYKKTVSGDGTGYGYVSYKNDFEKSMYITGPSSRQNSISPKLPVKIGQKIEYSVGAEGLYLVIYNEFGQTVLSLEENQNKGHKKGEFISEFNGYVVVGNNSNFEDGSDVYIKVLTNKELLTINDINNPIDAFGTVVGNDVYKKDTNNWLVYTEFDDIYKKLLEGQLYRVSSTEISLSVSNFWYHIEPLKFKKGDLIRYKLTGYGAEPMYIIMGSNNYNDVKFVKTFELYNNDGNSATTVEGELRVEYDCYIAFNIWNNPQITSLNYLKKGINGKKVTPQDLIEYSKPLSSGSGSVFKGRKIALSRPKYMEFKIRSLPPLDAGDARTPTEGEVDIVMDNRVVLTAKMKWSIQGHGSAKYPKKGYTFDFLNSEGKSLEIKFGDMISIDSFHLKAYATDTTHSRDISLGRIWRDMINTLEYPLSKVNNNIHIESLNPRKATIYTQDAKYHTDGIPTGVYVGDNFFGLYTLRLKKSRDNYALDRDNKNHIFLDSSTYTAYYAKSFNPVDWDLKSPRVSGYEEGGVINDNEVMANINRVFDFMTNLSTRYSEHGNYWVLSHWIDFYIHAELFQNIDINGNNNNLMTWDGTHWSPIPYDLDLTVGLDAWSSGGVVRTVRPQSLFLDFDVWGQFRTLFQTQIRLRYTQLRQSGFLTTKNLLPYFYNQVKDIPRDIYNDDLSLWGTIWTNDQPSLEQTGIYIESSIQYLDTRWLNYPIGIQDPKSLNISVNDATTRVPYITNGLLVSGGIQLSRAPIGNNASIRTSTGQLKALPAIEQDDVPTFSQVSGIINNTLTTSQTSSQLNSLYPNSPIGYVCKSITNNVEYTKISSTQWKKETINLV